MSLTFRDSSLNGSEMSVQFEIFFYRSQGYHSFLVEIQCTYILNRIMYLSPQHRGCMYLGLCCPPRSNDCMMLFRFVHLSFCFVCQSLCVFKTCNSTASYLVFHMGKRFQMISRLLTLGHFKLFDPKQLRFQTCSP